MCAKSDQYALCCEGNVSRSDALGRDLFQEIIAWTADDDDNDYMFEIYGHAFDRTGKNTMLTICRSKSRSVYHLSRSNQQIAKAYCVTSTKTVWHSTPNHYFHPLTYLLEEVDCFAADWNHSHMNVFYQPLVQHWGSCLECTSQLVSPQTDQPPLNYHALYLQRSCWLCWNTEVNSTDKRVSHHIHEAA